MHIQGESGSGKELVARLIHEGGSRCDMPFVPVNCGAMPTELMESEFFGHRKGSFTGAIADKAGMFQAAQGGTLFLDEVADLPLAMQVKLLRAIQERTYASFPPPTRIWPKKSASNAFGMIFTIDSTSSRSRYRHCAVV